MEKYSPMIDRLALGTVQFGFPYGIANQVGQVCEEEMIAILEHAWTSGINTLDTAIDYGESEDRLGKVGIGQWQVVSKLPEVPDSCTDVASWVLASVRGSLDRLKVTRLHGLLLHRPLQLLESRGDEIYRALVEVREKGLAGKIGASIYSPDDLDFLWSSYSFDLVQAPFNILDHRLEKSGWLERLNKAGTEIHVRSVFLQGLLLMDVDYQIENFSKWQPLWKAWNSWLMEHSLTPLQVCLGFVMSRPEINRIIVGVDSMRHLDEIVATGHLDNVTFPENLECVDLNLINPAQWGKS